LREEYKPRYLEKRVLRIFGTRRDDITKEMRRLHNEELCDPIKKNEMGWAYCT
jgi:hypothetical protein